MDTLSYKINTYYQSSQLATSLYREFSGTPVFTKDSFTYTSGVTGPTGRYRDSFDPYSGAYTGSFRTLASHINSRNKIDSLTMEDYDLSSPGSSSYEFIKIDFNNSGN